MPEKTTSSPFHEGFKNAVRRAAAALGFTMRLVFAELRKYLSATAPEATIWFYRDQSREVDFVIEKDGRLTLADAKWKELPGPRDFRQLLAVEPFLRTARPPAMVLCRTGESYPVGKDMLAVNGLSMREHF